MFFNVKTDVVAPKMEASSETFVHTPDSSFCHWYIPFAVPVAITLKTASLPIHTVVSEGCLVIIGGIQLLALQVNVSISKQPVEPLGKTLI